MPLLTETLKVWDKQGITKDEFFMRKYGNLSEFEREKLNRKNDSRRKQRDHFKNIEQEKIQQEKIEYRRSKNIRNEDDYKDGHYRKDTSMLEFVYGTHSVKAVLTANKRASYSKLYVYNCKDKGLIELATKHGIRVKYCDLNQELARLTKNGVHNGVVLETMKLPIKTIESLGECSENKYEISLFENENDEHATSKRQNVTRKVSYPLGLYLDRITDPQNMGNIIRSAFFFGVDFIVVPEENTAKLGSVANKASAGSLDLMNIYQCSQTVPFIETIRENGWSVISTSGKDSTDPLEANLKNKFVELNELLLILTQSPVLLVIGSEGYGIDNNIKVRSDFLVALEKGRDDDDIVDSLNVGVASGILIGECVQK